MQQIQTVLKHDDPNHFSPSLAQGRELALLVGYVSIVVQVVQALALFGCRSYVGRLFSTEPRLVCNRWPVTAAPLHEDTAFASPTAPSLTAPALTATAQVAQIADILLPWGVVFCAIGGFQCALSGMLLLSLSPFTVPFHRPLRRLSPRFCCRCRGG